MRYTQLKSRSEGSALARALFWVRERLVRMYRWVQRLPLDSKRDEGSAIVEFVGLGITLLIPIMYGVITIFTLQTSAMAAHSVSAQVAQYIREQPKNQSLTQGQADGVAAIIVRDYGVSTSDMSVSLSCNSSCTSDDAVRVDVTVTARPPLVPQWFGGGVIPVSSYSMSWGG